MTEDKSKKIFYTMGEVAEMLDVSSTTVRFWERRFSILKPHRNKKGNRLFTPTDVENLKLIYMLVKEQGMTLEGAKKALSTNRDEVLRKSEILERLLNVKAMLLEIKQELSYGQDEDELFDPQDSHIEPRITVTQNIETSPEQQTSIQEEETIEDQAEASIETGSIEPQIVQELDLELDHHIEYEKHDDVKEQTLF